MLQENTESLKLKITSILCLVQISHQAFSILCWINLLSTIATCYYWSLFLIKKY